MKYQSQAPPSNGKAGHTARRDRGTAATESKAEHRFTVANPRLHRKDSEGNPVPLSYNAIRPRYPKVTGCALLDALKELQPTFPLTVAILKDNLLVTNPAQVDRGRELLALEEAYRTEHNDRARKRNEKLDRDLQNLQRDHLLKSQPLEALVLKKNKELELARCEVAKCAGEASLRLSSEGWLPEKFLTVTSLPDEVYASEQQLPHVSGTDLSVPSKRMIAIVEVAFAIVFGVSFCVAIGGIELHALSQTDPATLAFSLIAGFAVSYGGGWAVRLCAREAKEALYRSRWKQFGGFVVVLGLVIGSLVFADGTMTRLGFLRIATANASLQALGSTTVESTPSIPLCVCAIFSIAYFALAMALGSYEGRAFAQTDVAAAREREHQAHIKQSQSDPKLNAAIGAYNFAITCGIEAKQASDAYAALHAQQAEETRLLLEQYVEIWDRLPEAAELRIEQEDRNQEWFWKIFWELVSELRGKVEGRSRTVVTPSPGRFRRWFARTWLGRKFSRWAT